MNEQLFRKYFDHELTALEVGQLKSLLQSDEPARKEFVNYVMEEGLLVEVTGMVAEELRERGQDSSASNVVALPRTRDSGPRRTTWIPLAVAAGLMLAVGGWWIIEGRGSRVERATVARVAKVNGECRMANAVSRVLKEGEEIRQGDELVTGAGATAQLKMTDGTTIDLKEKTRVIVGGERSGGETLRLEEGNLYCSVTPRKPGEPAFVIRSGAGPEIRVIGTKFEAGVNDGKTSVAVEEGTVQLSAGTANGVATPLLKVTADASGAISTNAVFLSEIAPWRFGQEDLPAGTVLFEDHFDGGLTNWNVRGGEMTLVEKEGVGGSRALRLSWAKGTNATLYPKFPVRCRNFEVVYRFVLPAKEGKLNFGVSLDTPPNVPANNIKPDFKEKTYAPFLAATWLTMKIAINGNLEQVSVFNGDQPVYEYTRTGVQPFTAWAIGWSETGGTVLIDDIVIRKK